MHYCDITTIRSLETNSLVPSPNSEHFTLKFEIQTSSSEVGVFKRKFLKKVNVNCVWTVCAVFCAFYELLVDKTFKLGSFLSQTNLNENSQLQTIFFFLVMLLIFRESSNSDFSLDNSKGMSCIKGVS